MNPLEIEIIKHIESFNLEEKALKGLAIIKEDISNAGGELDGYALDEMLFIYNRKELRIEKKLHQTLILARFDIYLKDVDLSSKIGFYDYVVDFNGNFKDDFFVIEK